MISLPAIELVVEEQHRDVCECRAADIAPAHAVLFLTFCNQQIVDLLHSVGRIDQAQSLPDGVLIETALFTIQISEQRLPAGFAFDLVIREAFHKGSGTVKVTRP